MREIKLSGPVTAIILALALLIVGLVGYRYVNPPQELGPTAKALRDGYMRSNPQ
jgi:hypothetical protein